MVFIVSLALSAVVVYLVYKLYFRVSEPLPAKPYEHLEHNRNMGDSLAKSK